MPGTTRQKIVAYIHEHRTAAAPEIGTALDLTAAAVRYHLGALLQAGSIEAVPLEGPHSRGRPITAYRLTSQVHPHNLHELADMLLDVLETSHAPGAGLSISELLAEKLLQVDRLPDNLTQRLNRTIQLLNEKYYQARWEARPEGPRITFRNCPYAALIPEHPELCQMDLQLLKKIGKQPFVQQTRIDQSTSSPPACVFLAARTGR